MTNRVTYIPITELLSAIIDNRGKSVPTIDNGFPLIATNCIKHTSIYPSFENIRYVSQDIVDNWFRAHLKPNDILFVNKGTPGRVCVVPNPVTFCAAQDMIGFRCDPYKIYYKYLLAALRSPELQKKISNYHVGLVIPHFKKQDLANLLIPVRDKNEQIRIGDLYFVLSEKIELNNRINAELEAMAKTLYDYWFVQFDFPDANGKPYKTSGGKMVWSKELKRDVPEGWTINSLGDLGNFKNGVNYDPSNPGEIACPIINVRNISASSYFLKNVDLDVIYLKASDVRKYAIHSDSIIIARSGIPGATRLISDFAENTLYCGFAIHYELVDLNMKIPIFFYLKSIEQQIQDGSGGTILKNVNQGTLNALQIALPNDNDYFLKFNKLIQPLFSKINLIQKENQKLTELRDWLLPMLMNGQVIVGANKAKEYVLPETENHMIAAEPEEGYKRSKK